MKRELAPITAFCKGFTQGSYPFSANSDSEIKLTNFDKIFGDKGQYQSFMNLNPQVVNATQVASFDELISKNSNYRSQFSNLRSIAPINKAYFQKSGGQLGFDYTVRIINVDPKIEKLIFNYGGKSYSYSHGPLETFRATWPKDSSRKVGFSAYIDEKRVDKVEADGEWALLKLIESGEKMINNGDKTVVKYTFNNKNAVIEFSSAANNSPFYLADLRRFSCP